MKQSSRKHERDRRVMIKLRKMRNREVGRQNRELKGGKTAVIIAIMIKHTEQMTAITGSRRL